METSVPCTVAVTGGLDEEAAMTLEKRRAGRHGPRPVHYPESDGKPMGETDLHREEMYRLITTLQAAFEQRPDVYVSGNLILYYEEGNPRASVAPDTFVVFGITKRRREIYKLWEEGIPPAVVIELTSRTTRREDLVKKRALYARLGIAEYHLYDPRFPRLQYLDPALQGLRLVEGEYQPIPPFADGSYISEALNMRLRLVDGRLRFFDNGNTYLSPAERAVVEAQRADSESRRANLEARRAEIEAERAAFEARRAEVEAQRAEEAARRLAEEARRADAEAEARAAAERRIAELEALLRERDRR
jgi:Uma2 family endonuclease